MEPERKTDVQRTMRTPNWTTLALIGGLIVLVLLVAYFATSRNADQDKLTGTMSQSGAGASDPEKLCASKATYDLIKSDLFRRAAQLRGSDQAAYDKLSAVASLRMENPVMESQDGKTGAVHCSGSLSLDLPPGVAVVGGRRSLSADVDYSIQPAADGSGNVVLLRNADGIIAPLATLGRVSQPVAEPVAPPESDQAPDNQPQGEVDTSEPAAQGTQTSYAGRPSFDCDNARTKSEIAVCADAGLAQLDRTMAAQYRRALGSASPEQQLLLRRTLDRFLAYRDRCTSRSCMGDAYTGRMREIRDIMEGNWSPPQR